MNRLASQTECDLETEFKCKSGKISCIPRSSVNNGNNDCLNGSDEYVEQFNCYEFEYACLSNISNLEMSVNSLNKAEYRRCLPYNRIRDGNNDYCVFNNDEKLLIKNCTHNSLFSCQDQSRCLPNKFKCDGIIHCIDASDEIEHCKYPHYFRYIKSNQVFIQKWFNFLVWRSGMQKYVFNFDAKKIIQEGKKALQKQMFGLKCNSSMKRHTVPQPKITSKRYSCKNQVDKCFSNLGEFTCFRCFDNTIILKNQVCDGIIDCQDLSDECPCEESKVRSLCEAFFNNEISPRNYKIICNTYPDLINSVDEIYCSNHFLFNPYDRSPNYLRIPKLKCAKGPTAHNHPVRVLEDRLHKYLNIARYVPSIEKELNGPYIHRSKVLYTDSDMHAGSCEDVIHCPFREDECSSCLFSTNEYKVPHFIKCFSFLFEDLLPFSIIWMSGESHFYFNNSNIHFIGESYSENKPTQIVNTTSEYDFTFSSKSKNITLDSREDYYTMCLENLLDCPWYFRCEKDKFELIGIAKACDFNFDCTDQSDEKYCSLETHFNCTSGNPVSIDRRKVNDDELDCNDRSDECKNNPISSAKEMIKSTYLRNFMWVSLIGIIVFNLVVIRNNIKEAKSIDDKHSTKYYNLVFVSHLSFSDILYGFALLAIAILSKIYSGNYCFRDFEWRSSLGCDIVGIFTLVSSQTSLNILVVMTGLRLYTVYKPFESLDTKKRKISLFIFLCWFLSFLLSITPIVLRKQFAQELVISSNQFLKNKKLDRIIKPNEVYSLAENIENVWVASKPNSIPTTKSIYNIRYLNN